MTLSKFAWNAWTRFFVFWVLVCVVVWGVAQMAPWFDLAVMSKVVSQGMKGDLHDLSSKAFAFAVASGIGAVALGFLVAFGVLHALGICFPLWRLRRRVTRSTDMAGFAETYDETRELFEAHPLIGHAWKEFDETLVRRRDENVIRNTIRPQTFINLATAREKLFGLKMMGAIPGYFVGVGLLLTFLGLVLALNEAAAAVSGSDANAMQGATRNLLQVATFKFATSIAGLGASIVLSFAFRAYTIWIEAAFDSFCHAVEARLRYQAPQSIASETKDLMEEQVAELKAINSADFFTRMGEEITPRLHGALTLAMEPVTEKIGTAVERLADHSQAGMSDMLERFSDSVQNGAGTELRELATTLKDMQGAMLQAQQGISGSGEDFGRRMSEAAENLNRLIADAGDKLGDSSEKSRTALLESVAAMRETFAQVGAQVEERMGAAAGGASSKMEEAMGRVLERLEAQADGFRSSLSGFQDGMASQMDETRAKVSAAQSEAAEAVGRASAEAAKALQSGLSQAMERINGEFDRFVAAMKSSDASLAAQANAVRAAAEQSRHVADAFQKTAQDVRAASAPLAQSGERIASVTERFGETIGRSIETLEASQVSSRQLAEALTGHVTQMGETWRDYAARFETVDEHLARAVKELGEATERQAQQLVDYASKVDQGFASAIDKLNPLLSAIEENTGEFGEAVQELRAALPLPQAAE